MILFRSLYLLFLVLIVNYSYGQAKVKWDMEKLTGFKTPPAGIIHSVSKTENGLLVFCTNQGIYSFDGFSYRHLLDDFEALKDWRYRYCRWAFFKNQRIYMVFPQEIHVVNIKTKDFEKVLRFGNNRHAVYAALLGDVILTIHSDGRLFKTRLSDLKTEVVRKDLGRVEWSTYYNSTSLLYRAFNGDLNTVDSNGISTTLMLGMRNVRDLDLYYGDEGEIVGVHSNGNGAWVGDTSHSVVHAHAVIFDTAIRKKSTVLYRYYSFSKDIKLLYFDGDVWLLTRRVKTNPIFLEGQSTRSIYSLADSSFLVSSYIGFYDINKKGVRRKWDSICGMSYDIYPISDNPNRIRILTECSGICEYDLRTKKLLTKLYGSAKVGLSGHEILTRNLTLFFGREMFLFDEVQQKLERLKIAGWSASNIRVAVKINKNELIIAGEKGLYLLNLNTRSIRKVYEGDFRWGLRSPDPLKLYFGVLGQGMFELDIQSLKFTKYTIPELNNTSGYFIYSALFRPGTNELYLGTGSGLYVLNISNKETRRVETKLIEFNSNSLHFVNQNILYAGGIGGVEYIRLDNRVAINDEPLKPSIIEQRQHMEDGSELAMYNLITSQISILSGTYETELFFHTPLDYVNKVYSWRYKVKGLHENWITKNNITGQRLSIVLSGLEPGSYTLELQLKHAGGNWGKSYIWDVHKAPKWFEIGWVQVLFVIGAVIFIGLIIRYYLKLRERENKEKLSTLMLRKNFMQSEIRSLRNQLNPHMFANAMQTIQYYILSKNKVEAAEYVAKYSHLMRKNLDNGAQDFITLEEEIVYIREYCGLEKMRRVEPLTLELNIDPRIQTEQYKIPSMILQPFVENAFKHGKASPVDNRFFIHIQFLLNNEQELVCIIENSIAQATAPMLQRIISGLEISRSRIELYNQYLGQHGAANYRTEGHTFRCEIVIPYQRVSAIEFGV